MYVNKAMVFGNLTRDPELRAMPNGGQVCSFAIATNRVYKNQDGSKATETEFHDITVFGRTAENCAMHLKKGSSAYVEGRLRTRSWEKDGTKFYRTEIVADIVQFGPRRSSADAQDDAEERLPSERADAEAPAANGEYPDEEDIDINSIPF